MANIRIQLDHAAIAALLKSGEFRHVVDGATRAIGRAVQSQVGRDVVVETESYTTDRAAGAVHIRDRRGTTLQAVKGVFTSAAASQGLTVRRSR